MPFGALHWIWSSLCRPPLGVEPWARWRLNPHFAEEIVVAYVAGAAEVGTRTEKNACTEVFVEGWITQVIGRLIEEKYIQDDGLPDVAAMSMDELRLLANFWCGGDWWQTKVVDTPLAGEVAGRETPWTCGP